MKAYETPFVEVVKFEYKDQVVVASGVTPCKNVHVTTSGRTCDYWTKNEML